MGHNPIKAFYLQKRGVYYVEFGGLGGDIITLTKRTYNNLRKPSVIQVTITPIFGDELEG